MIHTAGVSKAILAYLPKNQVQKILDNATFEQFTDTTITSPQAFLQYLDEVRKNGWACDRGEYEKNSNCIAAPVWDHSNEVVGAISITSFREVANIDRLLDLLPSIVETARAVSEELGWRPVRRAHIAHDVQEMVP